ncbi:MAG: thiamine pyrophosphate-dependent dehydrogenase E1 component subunit alpha [Nitrospinaceae bacterium]
MLGKELSNALFYDMLRIRLVEEGIADLYPEQEMRCPVHLCIGQEAIPVGVCSNLLKEDIVMGSHRSHGHYLAKGGDLKAMMAEIYGKATGCSKGKGGSMHLIDLSVNFLGTTPIVASIIPIAVGTAFATSMKNENRVTAIFLGRAATEEGVFAECLNFASLKKLPIVFISEDNFFSVYSPLSERQPEERDNVAIAKAYGIPGARGDGNNVQTVRELAQTAVQHARDRQGPYFLEFQTYRWREHCGPCFDNDLGYRSEGEYQKWKKRCPVENYKNFLIQANLLEKSQVDQMRETIRREFEEAVAFAKSSPFPDADAMNRDLYKEIELKSHLNTTTS